MQERDYDKFYEGVFAGFSGAEKRDVIYWLESAIKINNAYTNSEFRDKFSDQEALIVTAKAPTDYIIEYGTLSNMMALTWAKAAFDDGYPKQGGYDFIGTVVMPIAGIYYWVFGEGKTRYIRIESLELRLLPEDYTPVQKILKEGNPGTYRISDTFNYNSRSKLNVPSWLLLGNFPAHVEGTLEISSNGSYSFNGNLSIETHAYDANKGGSSALRNALTDILRGVGDLLGHDDYDIAVDGTEKVEFSGKL